ncbi:MAG: AAA family ATPase [Opitutales bacterium]|nr:AAA family ATPase [Opitutales bacterium]
MRIEKLHIDGFGIFHDTAMGEFADGLNLYYAPNEAGKSTLLDFIRFTLFGYPRSRSDRRPPLAGGDHGGRLWLRSREGRQFMVHRRGNRDISVELIDQNGSGETLFANLLGDASAELYQNVYALTLDELRGLEQLNEAGMENRIFSMGMGLGSLDYGAFEQDLQNRRDRYYKSRGKTQELVVLAREIKEEEKTIREQSAKVETYERLSQELEALKEKYQRAREAQGNARQASEKARAQVKAFPVYVEWQQAVRGEEGRSAYADQPWDARDTFRENQSRLRQLEKDLSLLEEEESAHQREGQIFEGLGRASVDRSVLVELTAAAKQYRDNLATRESLRREKERVAAERDKRWERIGPVENRDGLLGIEGLYRLRQEAEALQTRQGQRRNDQSVVARRQEEGLLKERQLREEIRKLEEQRKNADWPGDQALPEREKWLREAEFELEEALAQSSPSSQKPQTILSELPTLLAALLALIGAFLLWPQEKVWAVILGLAGVGVMVFGLIRLGKTPSSTRSPVDARKLHGEIEETKQRIEQVKQWQAEKARHEESLSEQQSLVGEMARQWEKLAKDGEGDQEAWASLRGEFGLPEALEPAGVNAFLDELESLQSLVHKEREVSQNLARCEEKISTFLERVRQEQPDIGENPAPAQIEGWLEGLREKEELTQKKKIWESKGEALTVRRKNILQEQRQLQKELQEAMDRLGVSTAEAFTQYYQRLEEKKAWREKREQAERSLQTLLGVTEWKAEVETLATKTPETLESQRAQAEDAAKETEERVEELNRALAALTQERKTLLQPDDLFARRNRVATLRNELTEKTREWLATKLALEMLGRAKQRYEEAHQPVVLRETKAFFSRITAGAYQDLRLSLTEKHVSLVASDGRNRGVAELSRGTREQLLLALRLGLISEYEQNREPLPIVLDDLLVNFDPDRAARIADVLTEFAVGRQIILFTCHPHTKEMFVERGARLVNP